MRSSSYEAAPSQLVVSGWEDPGPCGRTQLLCGAARAWGGGWRSNTGGARGWGWALLVGEGWGCSVRRSSRRAHAPSRSLARPRVRPGRISTPSAIRLDLSAALSPCPLGVWAAHVRSDRRGMRAPESSAPIQATASGARSAGGFAGGFADESAGRFGGDAAPHDRRTTAAAALASHSLTTALVWRTRGRGAPPERSAQHAGAEAAVRLVGMPRPPVAAVPSADPRANAVERDSEGNQSTEAAKTVDDERTRQPRPSDRCS